MDIVIEDATVTNGTVTLTVSNGPVKRVKVDGGPITDVTTTGDTYTVTGLSTGNHTLTVWGPNGGSAQLAVYVP